MRVAGLGSQDWRRTVCATVIATVICVAVDGGVHVGPFDAVRCRRCASTPPPRWVSGPVTVVVQRRWSSVRYRVLGPGVQCLQVESCTASLEVIAPADNEGDIVRRSELLHRRAVLLPAGR